MTRALFVVVALGLWCASADAYRPTARWILMKMGEKQVARRVQTLKLEQEVTLYGRKDAPRGLRVEQKTFARTPFQLRHERATPEGKQLEIYTAKRVLKEMPGQDPRASKPKANLFLHLATGGPPADEGRIAEAALQDLRGYGIDTGVVSYGRFDGRVAYIIGGKSYETDKSMVWIDKETMHLLRVKILGRIGGKVKVFDTQYTGWTEGEMRGMWPKSIARYEDGALKNREVTTSIAVNDPVDRGLFKIDR